MKTLLTVIVLFFSVCSTVFAQKSRIAELRKNGLELVYNLEFEKANALFDSMIIIEPENAQGYFLKSGNYFWRFSLNTQNTEIGETFRELSFKAVEVAEEMLDKDEDNIDAMFYLGGAYGNLGRYYGMTNSWLKAYWYGRKGKNYLKDVVEINPQYYDAYLGLGIYHYYADILPKFIKAVSFLFGIEGDKAKGLEELQLAVSKGDFTKSEAMFFLGGIYLDFEKDYKKSLVLFEELVQKYPNNFSMRLSLAKCYQNLQQHEQAIRVLTESLNSKIIEEHAYFKKFLYFNLARTYFELNAFDNALNAYQNTLLSYEKGENKKSGYYAWAKYWAAECYAILDSTAKAREFYQKINEDENKYAFEAAQNRLDKPLTASRIGMIKGRNYFQRKQFEKAGSIFDTLIKSEVKKQNRQNESFLGELYYNFAKVEFELKNYQNALATYNKVFNLKKINTEWVKPWSRFRLGNCYKELGEIEKAKTAYDLAYAYDDDRLKFEIDKARESLE